MVWRSIAACLGYIPQTLKHSSDELSVILLLILYINGSSYVNNMYIIMCILMQILLYHVIQLHVRCKE